MVTDRLLLDIACCQSAKLCVSLSDKEHPCSKIVDEQQTNSFQNFYLPEPWSGEILDARVLFLSSNPSIGPIPVESPSEIYPAGAWADTTIVEFFNGRFGSRGNSYIKNGINYQLDDGSYSKYVKFWSAVKARAKEIYQRNVIPGQDYAITEVEHCKSRSEIGVREASKHCSKLYLKLVLHQSNARIIVVLGAIARDSVLNCFPEIEANKNTLIRSVEFSGRTRLILFSPHPNVRAVRVFKKILTQSQFASVRDCVEGSSE